MMERRHVTL